MSKLNIYFNDKNYEINKSALSDVKSDFISHLGTIAGEGLIIVVDGVEYSVDPTKLAGAIASLESAFGSLSGGESGGSEMLAPGLYSTGAIALYESGDKAGAEAMLTKSWADLEAESIIMISPGPSLPENMPEMNEYGFYYGVPYNLVISGMPMRLFLYEDGSGKLEVEMDGEIMNMGEYSAGECIYNDHHIYVPEFGSSEGFSVSTDGLTLTTTDETGATMSLSIGDGKPPKDYVYCTIILDDSEAETSPLIGDLVLPNSIGIANSCFMNHYNLTDILIPNTVSYIGMANFSGRMGLSRVVIPEGVKIINDMSFSGCDSLKTVVLPSTITGISTFATFYQCPNLTDIIFNGTMEQLKAIANIDVCFQYVPATHVHCTDGDVAL